MKRVTVLLAALLLVLATAVPAAAAKPVPFEDNFDFLNCSLLLGLTPGDPDFAKYDFEMWLHTYGKATYSESKDASGNVIAWEDHASGTDSLYRCDGPSCDPAQATRVAKSNFGYTITAKQIDPATNQWKWEMKGTFWNIHVPGEGWIWKWSGHTTGLNEGGVDIFYQHRGVEDYFPSILCEYLR